MSEDIAEAGLTIIVIFFIIILFLVILYLLFIYGKKNTKNGKTIILHRLERYGETDNTTLKLNDTA